MWIQGSGTIKEVSLAEGSGTKGWVSIREFRPLVRKAALDSIERGFCKSFKD